MKHPASYSCRFSRLSHFTRSARFHPQPWPPIDIVAPDRVKHILFIGHLSQFGYSRKGGVRYMFGAYDMERDALVGVFAAKKNLYVLFTFAINYTFWPGFFLKI